MDLIHNISSSSRKIQNQLTMYRKVVENPISNLTKEIDLIDSQNLKKFDIKKFSSHAQFYKSKDLKVLYNKFADLMQTIIIYLNVMEDDKQIIKNSNIKLKQYGDQLEQKVEQRTKSLQETVKYLKNTQNQLVEAEKMSFLGKLLAGFSHSLNTPLSVCKGANSTLQYQLKSFKDSGKCQGI